MRYGPLDLLDGEMLERRRRELARSSSLEDDERLELEELEALNAEIGWDNMGEMVPEDAWIKYVRQMTYDLGYWDDKTSWPYDCIDWELVAERLTCDYTDVSFDGRNYWFR